MIEHLHGRLVSKSPTEIVVDVAGVGFLLYVPLSTFDAVGAPGDQVELLTHLHVREDLMQLYGFATGAERELFRQLLSVSGIGPKMALAILSGLNPADLRTAILDGNIAALTSVSGIGRKTAERIVLELRTKMGKVDYVPGAAPTATSIQLKSRSEALVGLMSLGYTRASAEKALREVLSESSDKDLSTEELIKRSLQRASKK